MPDAEPRPRRMRRLVLVVIVLLVAAGGTGAYVFIQGRDETASVPVFCERLALAQDLDQSLATLDPTTLGPQTGALQRALNVAPADIKPQLATLTAFVEQITAAVSASPTNKRDALVNALEQRQGEIDAVTAAGRAVQEWSSANCGISLNGTAD